MTIKYNQELTDHRNTKNQSEMYQRKKAKPVDITLEELKMSHDNHYTDHQIQANPYCEFRAGWLA